ncbi:MerR family transcriptional regulator [Halobacillus salinus]|uniref:MerR family transcriptional regulator n=1 Tax=Halobacillus salinus TaxID=192814 RepID=UPI0009A643C9|nr:MerR family transcriptional regulator [Halobacillus salinus]
MKKQTFSTGEIAKICNINKKTLFYYDQIDLLKPAIVESNGYRYYTNDQIDLLSKIKALQSVGFSLLQIKQQLSADNIPKGIDTLQKQKREISEKIRELAKVENLNHKILELEHYQATGNHQVFLKNYAEEYLYVDPTTRQEGIVSNFLLDGYHFGLVLQPSALPIDQMEMNKFHKANRHEEANFKKEEGTYAEVYFITGEQNIIQNAAEALAILQASGHSTSGEIFIKDIATDFALFENGNIPFQITRKVDDA